MFVQGSLDVAGPTEHGDGSYEFHSTMAATYAAAARLHAELAGEFESSGQCERALEERAFATRYEAMARSASESVDECSPHLPDSATRMCWTVDDVT